MRDTSGKVSWDDIELGSSEDEGTHAPKKTRPAAVPQGRSNGVRLALPSSLTSFLHILNAVGGKKCAAEVKYKYA